MLYYVRHGQSVANVEYVFAGQTIDSPLTEIGKEQAKEAGEKLKEEVGHIDKIISSPISRALDTAKIIAEVIGYDAAKIVVDPRWAEYDMGALTAQPRYEITSAQLVAAEGAEDPYLFRGRIAAALDDARNLPGNVLVVSHAGVGRMVESIRTNQDPRDFYDLPEYANASITRIDD